MWCLPASSSYPRVGKLHRRHHCSDSKCRELPILSDCSVILMSHFPHIARHPTISGLFLVQMLRYEMLLKLHCIQAGDKLHQRPLNPMSRHIWFPIYLCIALQPDRNVTNCRNLPDGQLFKWNKKEISYRDTLVLHWAFCTALNN